FDNDPTARLPAIKNLAHTESSANAVLDRIAESWLACCIYSYTQSLDAVIDIDVDIIKNILEKITIEQAHILYQLSITSK
ncbi:DNA polymerase III subunit gamma/tau, partial [Francisella tularensis subsp. holarctica]|nr:DNA polymerase III subunit gamma/tau [Francisella tularensis subsp. holarctica]